VVFSLRRKITTGFSPVFFEKKKVKSWHKNAHINPLSAEEKLRMAFASACRTPTAVRYWPAAVRKVVIN
jgi:hypothetical protein